MAGRRHRDPEARLGKATPRLLGAAAVHRDRRGKGTAAASGTSFIVPDTENLVGDVVTSNGPAPSIMLFIEYRICSSALKVAMVAMTYPGRLPIIVGGNSPTAL
jgi:hypothetical protein